MSNGVAVRQFASTTSTCVHLVFENVDVVFIHVRQQVSALLSGMSTLFHSLRVPKLNNKNKKSTKGVYIYLV